jgi:hypothetical protein
MSDYGPCETCGAVSEQFLIPVWEDISDYYKTTEPDYLGCIECHTMTPVGGSDE